MITTEQRIGEWIERFWSTTTYYIRCDACRKKVADEDERMLATTVIIGGWIENEYGDYLCKECAEKQRNGETLEIARPGRIKIPKKDEV